MANQGQGSVLVLGPGLEEEFLERAQAAAAHRFIHAAESLEHCLEVCEASGAGLLLVGEPALPSDDSRGMQHWLRLRTFRLVVVVGDQKPMNSQELFQRSRCAGVVRSGAPSSELGRMFDNVLAGEYWLPRSVLARAIDELLREREDGLTKRERDVLRLVRRGKPNREIAEMLFISKETVRWHLRSIYSKVGYLNRTQLENLGRKAASSENRAKRSQPASSTQ
ncbi:MAG: response regulator transcription factor [Bryobacterales bacterium]|nr:response regulator transcription factor [Bryobacterales bacterium]